ncbi:ubiquitin family protein [Thecamonas trahens ATCC 50062]|uniref:Ubiquitin family protein n=1 Tax=Thecamonas trahens ATCC 50062 TaxID=461836 RepID=A0A0L0DM16_THETB|nr:ubiquitin family protein [Thecamonas trahens ATCC 50062]KNC53364.1 ubiquitin family protein [Thecamonas trahens ATCC 50062]|eukprot:XP_013754410.1 ubiquitin family protein [Thecamonas trahens ATCC 50062]
MFLERKATPPPGSTDCATWGSCEPAAGAAAAAPAPGVACGAADAAAVDVESRARGDDWAHSHPLLLAAHVGYDAIAELLLACNADPTATTIGRDDGELDAAVLAAAAGHDVFVNDRLGTKLAVLMNDDDTVGELKLMIASQTGLQPERIRLQKADRVYKDHITLGDYEIPDGFNFEMFYN